MTKKEIYEGIVRLTNKLKATSIPNQFLDLILYAKKHKDYSFIDRKFEKIPYECKDLYDEIVVFGYNYNEMIGDTDENWGKLHKLLGEGGDLIYGLCGKGIIGEIAKEKLDEEKIIKLIKEFREEYGLTPELREYQKEHDKLEAEFKKFSEGEIFGPDPDEENGIYVFDINVIDPFSFFLFSILAHIDIRYLFQCDEYEEGSVYSLRSLTIFIEGIRDVTNNSFAEFVGEYCPLDWVGQAEGEYSTIGELFYDAICDKFTEHRSKLHVISYVYRN